jgi:hypothetical protein
MMTLRPHSAATHDETPVPKRKVEANQATPRALGDKLAKVKGQEEQNARRQCGQ